MGLGIICMLLAWVPWMPMMIGDLESQAPLRKLLCQDPLVPDLLKLLVSALSMVHSKTPSWLLHASPSICSSSLMNS